MSELDWLKDRVEVVVMNMENPGYHVDVHLNGYGFKLHHGVKVVIPRAVIAVLNEAVKTVYKIQGDIDKGQTRVATKEPRYMCTITNENPNSKVSAKEGIKSSVVANLAKRKLSDVEDGVE